MRTRYIAIGVVALGTLALVKVRADQVTTRAPYTATFTATATGGAMETFYRAVRSDGSEANWGGEIEGFHDVTNMTEVEWHRGINMVEVGPLVKRRVPGFQQVVADCVLYHGRNNPDSRVTCAPDGQAFGYPATKVTLTKTLPDGTTVREVMRTIQYFGWLKIEQFLYDPKGARMAKIEVTNFVPGEPDPKLFQIPVGMRKANSLVEFLTARAQYKGTPLNAQGLKNAQEKQDARIKEANSDGDHRFDQ